MDIINYLEIVNFIIATVQEESMGFQYIVDYSHIEEKFEVTFDSIIIKQVEELLCEREEVADVQLDDDGFDVVLYTGYAPNYIEEDDIY